jgi:stage II sporulation protein D
VVNVVDMEEYLAGVLSGELPNRFHVNAFKAQAIAARTYAFYQKATAGPERHWDVKATESSQMYLGIEGEKRSSKTSVAVRETKGMVCTWDSPKGRKIFCTYYSSTCGGLTQNVINVKGDKSYVPPLAGGVRCTHCENAKYYRWDEVALTKKTVTERLFRKPSFAHLLSLEYIQDVRVSAATSEGRPVWLVLIGAGGKTAQIRAEDFRLLMGGHTLKSTNFSLRSEPDRFLFYDGKGFGHGLGLCQNGAQVMAQAGRQADEILSFYYPGCIVEVAYP